ncbi:MAG TPA: ATP-dependent metallopeptidase FtsH/Yme1/Tma family protein, partial [bacterium]|nr:ATP-dependent metallopeptidase FtsH/Yme1/Tma family protein [bacterium]
MNNFFKGFALWALVFMAVMFFVRQTQTPKPQTDLGYSQFIAQVQDGKVKDVEFHPEDHVAIGTAMDDSKFKVVVPDDPNQVLMNQLLAKNVQVKIEAPVRMSLFWQIVLNLAPYLLIIGWFVFMMRQAQSGGGGAMAFGKSRARLMTTGQQKVTFADVAG